MRATIKAATTVKSNYLITLDEAETKVYRTNQARRNSLQSEAEMQANSRQCDVYLIAHDGKNLFRAWPRNINQQLTNDTQPNDREQLLARISELENAFCVVDKNHISTVCDLKARIGQLETALKGITDAYESTCQSWDSWCGNEACSNCGINARIISTARQALRGTNPQPIAENALESDSDSDNAILNDLDTLLEEVAERR